LISVINNGSGQGTWIDWGNAYRQLGASEELVSATLLSAKRTRESYTIMVPLIWHEVQRSGPVTVRDQVVPASEIVAGVPLYAFDEHTRLGKRAINRLVQENAALRACLGQFVPKRRWTSAAQDAAFYADGASVSRRFDWSQSRSLEALGIEADLSTAEVPKAGVEPLLGIMRASLGHLNRIRTEVWLAARNEGTA
jgi:hypothetical protein